MKLAILALDQAATSGYSMWLTDPSRDLGVMVGHGTARSAKQRTIVLDTAFALAAGNDCPLHVVLEDHSKIPSRRAKGKTWGTATILGMGDARGRWREQLELREHPKSHQHMVPPDVWRGAVLGAFYAKAKGDVAKEAALRHATGIAHRTLTSDDEAEAICLGQYSAQALPAAITARRKVG